MHLTSALIFRLHLLVSLLLRVVSLDFDVCFHLPFVLSLLFFSLYVSYSKVLVCPVLSRRRRKGETMRERERKKESKKERRARRTKGGRASEATGERQQMGERQERREREKK